MGLSRQRRRLEHLTQARCALEQALGSINQEYEIHPSLTENQWLKGMIELAIEFTNAGIDDCNLFIDGYNEQQKEFRERGI